MTLPPLCRGDDKIAELESQIDNIGLEVDEASGQIARFENKQDALRHQIREIRNDQEAKAMQDRNKRRREFAKELAKTMRCFCDLDTWEPERTTGHSHVCPIHDKAMRDFKP